VRRNPVAISFCHPCGTGEPFLTFSRWRESCNCFFCSCLSVPFSYPNKDIPPSGSDGDLYSDGSKETVPTQKMILHFRIPRSPQGVIPKKGGCLCEGDHTFLSSFTMLRSYTPFFSVLLTSCPIRIACPVPFRRSPRPAPLLSPRRLEVCNPLPSFSLHHYNKSGIRSPSMIHPSSCLCDFSLLPVSDLRFPIRFFFFFFSGLESSARLER